MRERKRISCEEKGGVACFCLLLVWQFDPLWLMTLCFWTLEEPHRRLIEEFELQMCETKALATRRNPFLCWKFSEMDFLPHLPSLGLFGQPFSGHGSSPWTIFETAKVMWKLVDPTRSENAVVGGFVTDGTGVAKGFVTKRLVFPWRS